VVSGLLIGSLILLVGRSAIFRSSSSVLPTAATSIRAAGTTLSVFVWPELTTYHLNHFTPSPGESGWKFKDEEMGRDLTVKSNWWYAA